MNAWLKPSMWYSVPADETTTSISFPVNASLIVFLVIFFPSLNSLVELAILHKCNIQHIGQTGKCIYCWAFRKSIGFLRVEAQKALNPLVFFTLIGHARRLNRKNGRGFVVVIFVPILILIQIMALGCFSNQVLRIEPAVIGSPYM